MAKKHGIERPTKPVGVLPSDFVDAVPGFSRRLSHIKKLARSAFVVLAFFCSSALGQPSNGDRLTNLAALSYQGLDSALSASSDVVFRTLGGSDSQPPTGITLSCRPAEGESDCRNGEIPENSGEFILGDLIVTDEDSNTHNLSVLDDIRFNIVDGVLRLAEGESFDFEAGETEIEITIRATDPEGLFFDQVFSITILDVNEPPFDLISSNNFVVAGSDERRIGLLTASDFDSDDTQSFSVLGDDRFEIIDGNILSLVDGVVLDENVTIPVTVIVTDKGGLTTRTLVEVTTNVPDREPGGLSTIKFMAPSDSGEQIDVPEATCSPPEGFLPDGGVQTSLQPNLAPGDLSGPQDLDTADAYAIGDPLFVSVEDQQANLQPFELDRIDVRLEIDGTGDSEILTLVETDIDTGIFVAFVFTTSQQSVTNDCILTVVSRTQVDASYTDRDGLQTVTTLVQISPVSIVFNDETGEPISGVILALIDVGTGLPADVRGDGPEFSLYPSTIRTGETVTDAAGNTYVNGPGEYRFTAIPEGTYRLVIFNDDGWNFSEKTDEDIQSLGGATTLERTSDGRFSVTEASRGEPFTISKGAVPRIDIAVDQAEPPTVPEPSPSQIEFFQFSSNPNIGAPVDVAQTSCVAGVERQVSELNDVNVPVPGVINLAPATVFKVGQPIFVQVTDLDQNFDPNEREDIIVELTVPASADSEFIRLVETGPDTGTFAGYIQSTGEGDSTVATSNCELSVVPDESIWTGYADIFDETDVSEALVLVDPFGRIFSTKDGRLIDGVTVTLIDTSTGAPADVFGDGPAFAPFPSTIVSGGETRDEAGLFYDFPAGEYRFPFVEPGFYQLRFENIPDALIFPSTKTNDEIQTLTGAPFEIVTGSRGEEFEVPVGPAINIDIPLDEPDAEVFVSKQASRELAAIGDFIQWRLNIENRFGTTVRDVQVEDILPKGFRYQQGSLRIDGERVEDPNIEEDGRTMTFDLPAVNGVATTVTYVSEITSVAEIGEARNQATVFGDQVASSNTAFASVMVRNDLFSEKAFLVGRVVVNLCKEGDNSELLEEDAESEPLKGVPGVRIYLEDGSYVVTDENGSWHMEGIEPGTHIVQMDVDSLEERYEASPCNSNSRFAGSPYSQFVDVQGGTLWRADFEIQDKPAPESQIELEQTLKVDEDGVWVEVKATNGGAVRVSDNKAIYTVPSGWEIVTETQTLDGVSTGHQSSIVGSIFDLGDLVESKSLRFMIRPRDAQLDQQVIAGENQLAVLRPRFATRSANLSDEDKRELDQLVIGWRDQDWQQITIIGHSDDVPIAPRNRNEFGDNQALSEARAASVAEYIGGKLKVGKLMVVGAGEKYPIASNATRQGRQSNRRVEFLLKPEPVLVSRNIVNADVLNGESFVRMSFNSAGTPKGKTATSKLPLNRLVGGFDKLSATVTGTAVGSWDLVENLSRPEVAERDPNVQGMIFPTDNARLGLPVQAVKFDLDSRLKPKLSLDGVEISSERIGFKMADEKTGKTLYNYIGVDFGGPGTHKLLLEGMDPFGNARYSETINVVRVGELYDIRLVSSEGNVADGRTPVKAKLELLDRAGEPLGIEYRVQLSNSQLRRNISDLSLSDLSQISDVNFVDIDSSGFVQFDPVSVSGTYPFTLKYNDFEEEFKVFVEAEKRDWIMVGLAEGSAAYNNISGNMVNAEAAGLEDEVSTDGRVAFYAKGQVKGEYVLTIAYDTAKEKKSALEQTIDPNSFYTLYGDRSSTRFDAASQEKLFLKLEKDQFYALFGDFTTGIDGGELSTYSRSLSGLKTEYQDESFDVVLFASETDQAFIKDEIRGDGTSGLYRLTTPGLIVNSEKISIETRDRFRPQDILEVKELRRHIDYNIDYDAGTLFFKEPIFSQDSAFNPQFIVVDYEVDSRGADELNYGGRVAYSPNEDLEVGVTLVREGVERRESDLLGLDVEYQLNGSTQIRAEVATTESTVDGVSSDGTAYIVEATHRSGNVDAQAYIREQQGAFGLGQQNDSESGTRRVGIDARYEIAEGIEVAGELYRDTNLGTGSDQDVASSVVQMRGDDYSVSAGVRSAMTSGVTQDDLVSNQLLLGGSYQVLEGRLVVSANADTLIGGKGEAGDFPKRLRVGLDYKLTDNITLKAEQEFTWGDEQDTQGTRIGMSTNLWEGGELVTSVEQSDEENSQRLAAVAGLKQGWNLNENWSFDFGIDRSQTIKQASRAVPNLQVTTVFNSPSNNDFTSVTFGSKFKKDAWDWATRVEYREADTEDRINLVSDVIHNLEEGQQLLAKLDVQTSDSADFESTAADIQLSYSYRPNDSRWTLFNRLDLQHQATQNVRFEQTTQKIINNLNANYQWSPETQIAFQYGLKYVVDNFDSDEYRGFTDLYGMEVRHDLNNKWDIGLQGSFYNSHNADVSDYSYGVSFGYNMARNVWVSLGYNFDGFQDDDFSAAEYTSEGIYLKYRLKFDQNTADSILGLMSNQ